ncbi:MAG TPA: electron transfer flavoprotein subunit beta/FixA family protein [Gaiellaceae bacterium]|nr:electron transfer flavoprotein subunit beta/FixA family protein [Gaiellaceae bacterium]
MKIVVCVKAVPDASAGRKLDPSSKRLVRSGELTLSDFDSYAVEEALQIGGETVVLSMGPERALDALRKALAMGADRAVLVSDEALAGSDLLGTASALAEAIAKEEPDLVLFGQQSADGGGACIWAAVAEKMRRPAISQVSELSVDDGTITGKRQTEFGYDTIRAPLPAIVAVSDAINTPRYPSLKGIMGAKKKPQETVSASAVASGTTVLELSPPPARGDSVKIEDDGSAAEKIVEFLAEKRLV